MWGPLNGRTRVKRIVDVGVLHWVAGRNRGSFWTLIDPLPYEPWARKGWTFSATPNVPSRLPEMGWASPFNDIAHLLLAVIWVAHLT